MTAKRLPVALRPLHPRFGAEVLGIEIGPEDRGQTSAIESALDVHGLLLFRDVAADDDALERIAAQFGSLQNVSGRPDQQRYIIRVSNLDDDGAIKAENERSRLQHEANRLWHTDSSFISPGARYSFLHARVLTREGGQTQFCDTREAWDSLPPARQAQLSPLYADHLMLHSWKLTGVDLSFLPDAEVRPVRRALAPVHKPTGRRALMIPSHVVRVQGLGEAETATLLAELIAVATERSRVYTHEWRPNDLLIWDNRCMLHRVTPYAGLVEPRDLRSCRVQDVGDDSAYLAV